MAEQLLTDNANILQVLFEQYKRGLITLDEKVAFKRKFIKFYH